MTWRQSLIYTDFVTLYQDTLKKKSACLMAHYNLGIARRDRGQNEQAIAHYRQARGHTAGITSKRIITLRVFSCERRI